MLEGGTVSKGLPRYDLSLDAQFPRDAETACRFPVRDHNTDDSVDALVAAGACHGFHVGTAARDENAQPQRSAPGHSLITTPVEPLRTSPMRLAVSPRSSSRRMASSA